MKAILRHHVTQKNISDKLCIITITLTRILIYMMTVILLVWYVWCHFAIDILVIVLEI